METWWTPWTPRRWAETANSNKGGGADERLWIVYPLIGWAYDWASCVGSRDSCGRVLQELIRQGSAVALDPRVPVGGLLDWSLIHVCIFNLFFSQSLGTYSSQDYWKYISRDHYLSRKKTVQPTMSYTPTDYPLITRGLPRFKGTLFPSTKERRWLGLRRSGCYGWRMNAREESSTVRKVGTISSCWSIFTDQN